MTQINLDETGMVMTTVLSRAMPIEIKRVAVRLLLETENQAERLRNLITWSGFSLPLLRRWEAELMICERQLYGRLLDEANRTMEALCQEVRIDQFDLHVRLRQLEQIQLLQRMVLDSVRPIFTVWGELPLVWRIAAAIYGGEYTLDQALTASDVTEAALTHCLHQIERGRWQEGGLR